MYKKNYRMRRARKSCQVSPDNVQGRGSGLDSPPLDPRMHRLFL